VANFDVVFEGGGAKGIAFLGALAVLEEGGHQLDRLIGTSAGAITATLCAAGYSLAEIKAAVMEKVDGKPRFSTFMDIPQPGDFSQAVRDQSVTMEALREVDLPLIGKIANGAIDKRILEQVLRNKSYARAFSFVECGGFYSGATFLRWIEEKLAVKHVGPNDTMKTFAAHTGKDLSLAVSDTTDMELLILNHRTAPDVPVADAVRMSMSIPFVWQEVVWNPAWGTYMGRPKANNILVDGGLLSNFPIRLIATTDDQVRAIMGDTDPAASLNLGLLIDEQIEVRGAANTTKTPLPLTHLRSIQRVSRLADTMLGAADNEMIRRFEDEICRLPAKGYGTLEFEMADQRLDLFIGAARAAMLAHMEKRGL